MDVPKAISIAMNQLNSAWRLVYPTRTAKPTNFRAGFVGPRTATTAATGANDSVFPQPAVLDRRSRLSETIRR